MGRNKVERTEQITNAAVMQETDTKFYGQRVFILVPVSTGIDPKELAAKFTEQINGLMAVAREPTNKDIIEMSGKGIDIILKSALESEN